MPTTSGNGRSGGGPWSRFSSQYRTDHSLGVDAATLVNASVGVSTCLPKLAWGSFGEKGLMRRALLFTTGPAIAAWSSIGASRSSHGQYSSFIGRFFPSSLVSPPSNAEGPSPFVERRRIH